MPWMSIAAAVAGSVVSGAISGGAAESAANTQADAANRATDSTLQMFNTQNDQQAPWRAIGQKGLGSLGVLAGLPGYDSSTGGEWQYGFNNPSGGFAGQTFSSKQAIIDRMVQDWQSQTGQASVPQSIIDEATRQAEHGAVQTVAGTPNPLFGAALHQFNADDLKTNLAPNYEFMKQQGIGATTNAANASGGALSGNALKGITDYAENYAGNAYQNAFANYTTNQNNIFSRLSQIAGLGTTANQQSVQAFGTAAPNVSSSMQNVGTAQAGGTVGAANAVSGGVNNAMGWYNLGQIANPQGAANQPLGQEQVPGQYSLGNVAYG